MSTGVIVSVPSAIAATACTPPSPQISSAPPPTLPAAVDGRGPLVELLGEAANRRGAARRDVLQDRLHGVANVRGVGVGHRLVYALLQEGGHPKSSAVVSGKEQAPRHPSVGMFSPGAGVS